MSDETTPKEPTHKGPNNVATRFSSDYQPAKRGKRTKDKLSLMFDMRHRLTELNVDLALEWKNTYDAAETVAEKRKLLELAFRHTLPTYSKVEAEITQVEAPKVMWLDDYEAAVQMTEDALEAAGHVIDADYEAAPEHD